MKDDGLILTAWGEALERQAPAVLATVVKVSGSAYRSPGARMLVTENGGRIGSISGGCLEGDVLKKAWWLTSDTPAAVRVYDNTSEEDAIWEFGLGCNGIVHVLLERWESAAAPVTVDLLHACRTNREGGVLATIISGEALGQRHALFPDGRQYADIQSAELARHVSGWALRAFQSRESSLQDYGEVEVFVEYIAPPVPLLVVGAGHDALPLVRLAKELGWDVTVVDGRSNQARADRFPQADAVIVSDLASPLRGLAIDEQTTAVLMSHSYEQDSAFLNALLRRPIRYLGVLGPRKRTQRMLEEHGLAESAALHAPVGLDIGADTPEEIALAIVGEIQATLTGRDGGMLLRRPGPIHDARREPLQTAVR